MTIDVIYIHSHRRFLFSAVFQDNLSSNGNKTYYWIIIFTFEANCQVIETSSIAEPV